MTGTPGNDEKLTPATDEALAQALSFTLRFGGRRRLHNGDEFMADLTAQHLIDHLKRPGYVVIKRRGLVGVMRRWNEAEVDARGLAQFAAPQA
jgi:hypothetical protein